MKMLATIILLIALPALAQYQIGAEKTTRRLDVLASGGRISTMPRTLADSCVLGLPFSRDNGTNYYDVFGAGYDGIATNVSVQPTWSSDVGGSLVFDGINDTIEYGNVQALNFPAGQDFTLASWFKTDTANTYKYIFAKGNIAAAGHWLFRVTDNNTLLAAIRDADDGTAQSLVTGAVSVVDGAWHLGAATFDRDGLGLLYLDGVRYGPSKDISASSASLSNAISFRISMRFTTALDYAFSGSLASPMIFNRVLTSNELATLYQTQKGRYGL